MGKLSDNQKQYLVDAVINTRDFCGNESEALADAAADLKIRLSKKGKQVIMHAVEQEWVKFQKSAGVTSPIDSYERAAITKIMGAAE